MKDSGRLGMSSKMLTVDELLKLHLDGLDADGRGQDPVRLPPQRRRLHQPAAGLPRRPRRHAGGDPGLAAQARRGWRDQARQAARAKDHPPGPGAVGRRVQAGGRDGSRRSGAHAGGGPKARRSIPKHWSPEEAREFLSLMEGDRTYAVWAFLLGSGLRIGELVWLRWRVWCRTPVIAPMARQLAPAARASAIASSSACVRRRRPRRPARRRRGRARDLRRAEVAASGPGVGMFGRRRAAREVAQRRDELAAAR